jgi:hypothetical protein
MEKKTRIFLHSWKTTMAIRLKSRVFFCLFFLACLRSSNAAEPDYQCFVPGECILSQHIDLVASTDEVQCLKMCQSTMDCTWFTFYPETGSCQLFANCAIIDDTQCPLCKTGQAECSIPGPVCWVKGHCLGNVIHTEEKIRFLDLVHKTLFLVLTRTDRTIQIVILLPYIQCFFDQNFQL